MSTPQDPDVRSRLERVSEALTRAATAQRAGGSINHHIADAVRHMRDAAAVVGVGPEELLAAMRRAWSASNGDGRHDEAFADIVRQCMREYFRQERDV